MKERFGRHRNLPIRPGVIDRLAISARKPGWFKGDLKKGRSGCFLIWGHDDVFEAAIRAVIDDDADQISAIEDVLHEKLKLPENAARRVGCAESDIPSLAAEPGWLYLLPWDSQSIEERKQQIDQVISAENQLFGLLGGASEGGAWGNAEKLAVESQRLLQTFHSIKARGYKNKAEDGSSITVTACCREDGDYIWLVNGGNHRFSILKAMNVESVTILVSAWVYRSEVSEWPNVKSGLYTKKAALKVFDQLFE